jgi:hypothetical protein
MPRIVRKEPCPRCGAYMLWTEKVFRTPGADPDAPRLAAYVCENPACGLVLDPSKHPRE